jgi:hypothetical protein
MKEKIEQEMKKRMKEQFEKCGRNGAPHNYEPIGWDVTKDTKRASHMMCKNCYMVINLEQLQQSLFEKKPFE